MRQRNTTGSRITTPRYATVAAVAKTVRLTPKGLVKTRSN